MKNLVLLGPPGSGKGTQAQLLEEKCWVRISTGDLLRENIKNETEIGKKVMQIMSTGKLVDNETVFELVKNKIENLQIEKAILDGFPRNLQQAMLLEEYSRKREDEFIIVLIELSDYEIARRNTGRRTCSNCEKIYNIHFSPPRIAERCDECSSPLIARADDVEEVIQERIRIYRDEIKELVNFYGSSNHVQVVDGALPADKIHATILNIIEESSDRDKDSTRNIKN
ncbi:MAG: hypothetical protein A2Y62_03030 [Candidatus Fischerbacteria bacterium RBG_13_37_8]|uniref:Adenylate kinase n=1 Tax=Candidatus Fischerbacteria bacterium RBG_13_37_8 TaxID=1817863 RepID=A0A1F5VE89_9BACT|nr:MAG: hypothetical protein A2Y62_03030 [Candidatus Fischerbacteria bacterium RBG_13_37_8]